MRLVLTSEETDVRALHMVDDEHSGTKGRGGMRKQSRLLAVWRLRLARLVLLPVTPGLQHCCWIFTLSQHLGTLGSSWNLCVFANSQSQLLKRLHLQSQRKKNAGNLLRGQEAKTSPYSRVNTSREHRHFSILAPTTGTTLMCDLHLCFSSLVSEVT